MRRIKFFLIKMIQQGTKKFLLNITNKLKYKLKHQNLTYFSIYISYTLYIILYFLIFVHCFITSNIFLHEFLYIFIFSCLHICIFIYFYTHFDIFVAFINFFFDWFNVSIGCYFILFYIYLLSLHTLFHFPHLNFSTCMFGYFYVCIFLYSILS